MEVTKLQKVLMFLAVMFSFSYASTATFTPLDSFSEIHIESIQHSYDSLLEKTPAAWRSGFAQGMGLAALNKKKYGSLDPICKSDGTLQFGESNAVLGYVKNINQNLKYPVVYLHEDLIAGVATGKCTKEQIKQLRERTLVHELSHIYDDDINNISRKSLELGCTSTANTQPITCLKKHAVSDDTQFLFLTGFSPFIESESANGEGSSFQIDKLQFERMNIFTDRSPRSYENVNPQEYFAVNMELFILDSKYKCHRPALFSYLKNHFNFDPYPQQQCNQSVTSVLDSKERVLKLDPSRIYSIHYMTASPGSEIASFWGHSLLRLIVCSPERQIINEECLKDLKHHIVIDFAAQLLDEQLSLYGGLTGKYPSGINFRNFSELRQETLVASKRDVSSYPLKLNRSQIEMFTKVITEKYWTQITKYLFLQNNCATQVIFTLLSSFSNPNIDRSPTTYRLLQKNSILTPSDVVRYLASIDMIDIKNYSRVENETQFTNTSTSIKERLLHYSDVLPMQLSDLLKKSNTQRGDFYENVLRMQLSPEKSKELKLLFIEVEQIKSADLNNNVAKFFTAIYVRLIDKKTLTKRSVKESLSPQNSLWEGYGVPSNIDKTFSEIVKKTSDEKEIFRNTIIESMTDQDKNKLSDFRVLQNEITKNIEKILLSM